MRQILSIFIFLLFMQVVAFGQDTLPKISVSQIGRKSVISWVNPYSNVTNINIQRSGDSLRGFSTIGSVIGVDARTNGFMDTKEFLPADQYYRLFISFEGGTYLFTESRRPVPDTTKAEIVIEIPEEQPLVKTWFVPSKHVYTGKDNNVIISLPDAARRKYSVKFFDDDGVFLFEVKNVTQPFLTVDKVNFGRSGLFNFELFDNRLIIEKHKFYIPRDGRPMPGLDANGYEKQ